MTAAQRIGIVVGAGASAGLGGALCRRFAREGLRVVAVGRTREKLERMAAESVAAGAPAGAIAPLVADCTREADVARIFDAARELGGAPEIVVYNTGNNRIRPLLEMDAAFFEEAWRTCCLGGFLVGREAARRMLPPGGTLLFTGATASVRARPPFTAFASAKAALWRASSARAACTWRTS
jgi:NAD(P)-dependent dehydrogenase (short-subunit alcohol dehydrogenase family)